MTLLIKGSGVDLSTTALGDVFTTSGRPLAQAWTPLTFTTDSGALAGGIVFPSFDKTYGYTWYTVSHAPPANQPADYCTTYGRLAPQEWGPSALGYTSPHILDDIDLGAAPDGADFLEMSVNLTQAAPDFGSAFTLIDPWPCEISQGGWMDCEDGCCPVEAMAGIARQFWVEIVAGRMVLRRQQSVSGILVIPSGASGIADQHGILTHHLDDRTGNGSNSNLGGSNQCNITNSVDYTTTYTGTLIVTPVNYRGND